MNMPVIGFLPLYLKLYDDFTPEVRPRLAAFNARIQDQLKTFGLEVVAAPICRIAEEFDQAVRLFIEHDVQAVVTMHLAYSPSLESIGALRGLNVPLIILDTTENERFDQSVNQNELMFNHGIHGVQDLCNLLARHGIRYFLETGHYEKSDVMARVARLCQTAAAVRRFRRSRIGIVGKPFPGMGDFAVPFEDLQESIGIQVFELDYETVDRLAGQISDPEVQLEIARDQAQFNCCAVSAEKHRTSVRAGLIVRKWLTAQNLSGFTVNFLDVGQKSVLNVMPFLEAGKAMARGIGYAGEGDVLTAALAGALSSVEPDTTFTEMFCPDWAGNSIFLSHMGEMNLALAAARPIMADVSFPYTDACQPVTAYAQYRPGRAVLVNLAPLMNHTYRLILIPGEILNIGDDAHFERSIHGWFRPDAGTAACLKQYSEQAGTHHLVMVYGEACEWLADFGRMSGYDVVTIH